MLRAVCYVTRGSRAVLLLAEETSVAIVANAFTPLALATAAVLVQRASRFVTVLPRESLVAHAEPAGDNQGLAICTAFHAHLAMTLNGTRRVAHHLLAAVTAKATLALALEGSLLDQALTPTTASARAAGRAVVTGPAFIALAV
jgi:hypothetical protein